MMIMMETMIATPQKNTKRIERKLSSANNKRFSRDKFQRNDPTGPTYGIV